jgi:hypothetical protein
MRYFVRRLVRCAAERAAGVIVAAAASFEGAAVEEEAEAGAVDAEEDEVKARFKLLILLLFFFFFFRLQWVLRRSGDGGREVRLVGELQTAKITDCSEARTSMVVSCLHSPHRLNVIRAILINPDGIKISTYAICLAALLY